HSISRQMGKGRLSALFERSVFIVEIKEILFFVVVCNIDVRPTIIVHITNRKPEAEINSTSMYASFLAYFFEERVGFFFIARDHIIAIKAIAKIWMSCVS